MVMAGSSPSITVPTNQLPQRDFSKRTLVTVRFSGLRFFLMRYRIAQFLCLFLVQGLVLAQECNKKACQSCLMEDGCVWSGQTCQAECLQDVSCFFITTTADETIPKICARARQELLDSKMCAIQRDCTSCTSTTTTVSNESSCQWYTEGNACRSGCTLNGCGDTECNNNDDDDDEEECSGLGFLCFLGK